MSVECGTAGLAQLTGELLTVTFGGAEQLPNP